MDGSDRGTPNPLNPMSGSANGMSAPRSAMPEMRETRPAHTMPEMREARPAPRPVANYDIVDPMMRSVPHDNRPAMQPAQAPESTPSVSVEETFNALSMDDNTLDMLTKDITATGTPSRTEITQTETFNTDLNTDLSTDLSGLAGPNLVAKDSIVEPAKKSKGKGKKKKTLIISAVILLLIALACGIAAVVIVLLNNNGDQFAKAMEKMISGEMPTIIAAQGKIDTNIETTTYTELDEISNTGNLAIDFSGTFDTTSSMNKISADIAMNFDGGANLPLNIEEMRNKTGSTYFKISGLSKAVSAMGEDNIFSGFSGLLEAADNTWISISDDYEESMEDLEIFDNPSTCLVGALTTLPNYSKDILAKYKANPFVEASTDNLGITKKNDTLYRLAINSSKLSAFANSLGNNGFVNELNACAGGTASNSGTTATMIEDIFGNFPTIYAEVDNNNNFTRFYFQVNIASDDANSATTADISLSYPKEFKISEPTTYITMSDLLNEVMSSLIETTDITVETTN